MKSEPQIRRAKLGDEKGIHEAHMRSIREVCVKDHGEDEISCWGNRALGDRWTKAIEEDFVWVVEFQNKIHGHAYIQIEQGKKEIKAFVYGLYLTPEVLGQGGGKKLLALMINEAKNAGVKTVRLDSTKTAHEFYLKQGFLDEGPSKKERIGKSTVTCIPMLLEL